MKQKYTVPFQISSMDSLGQGVSKETSKITFIGKTVVGDKGEAEIVAERKGVAFAKMTRLSEPSALRIKPICPHFEVCPSCHYLHVDYASELSFKKENFLKLFRKLPLPEVTVVPGSQRLGYRNRIQLHYDLQRRTLGMFNQQENSIAPIPECLIGMPEVKAELERLYLNDQWIKEAPTAPLKGHVEIYWHQNKLQLNWNKPYAEGGFTQVFEEMNQMMKKILQKEMATGFPTQILDLFGGNGNLTADLNYSKRLCVDIYTQKIENDFYNQNLYLPDALKSVLKEMKHRQLEAEVLILDPPRSGLKGFQEWLSALKPKAVAYVSCDPHTLARDINECSGYSVKSAFLIDFFPSTYHYESLIILERNS